MRTLSERARSRAHPAERADGGDPCRRPAAARGVGAQTAARRIGAALSACCMAVLAGCSTFGLGPKDDKPRADPNLFPDNYKALLLTRLQTNPYGLVGAREAFVSAPALKQFGTESRYFACLRVVAPDLRKDKLVVFYAAEINQFVDTAGDDCVAAAYQPFPEMTAALARFGGKK